MDPKAKVVPGVSVAAHSDIMGSGSFCLSTRILPFFLMFVDSWVQEGCCSPNITSTLQVGRRVEEGALVSPTSSYQQSKNLP